MKIQNRETKSNNSISVSNDRYDAVNIAADRFENLAKELADQMRNEFKANIKPQLALPDSQFITDLIIQCMSEKTVSEITPEKKRLNNRLRSRTRFFDNIRENGGLYTSAEVAKLLGVSKVTVKKKKDTSKLLALDLNGEFVFPAFQFTVDDEFSEKGILKGVAEILPNLTHLSDVMQYGFFVQKRNVLDSSVLEGKEFTIISMLKNGVNGNDLQSIIRLTKTFGTQDPA
ncbi:MAG: hypothetical protein OFPI_00730 [Osedax symbiont Rs2]|nr:MAG: hypothetical protein OFPI_00730 [Osedax symbiont Rs2]